MSADVVGYIIGAGGLCFGAYSYFTSGILADKTKIIEHGVKIDQLERRMKDVEEDADKLKDKVNQNHHHG